MLYSDYLDYWMKEYFEINYKYTTAKRYSEAFESIKKELGKYRLAYLTSYVLNQALLRIAQKVNSKDALRNYQKVIRSSLRDAAYYFGFIENNPAADLQLPRFYSFEVFIKPDNYESQIEGINNILNIVKEYVSENSIINNLINQRNELNKILKLNTKRTSINSTGLGKALATGNKIINIPEELSEFSEFLNSKNKVKWYSWQNSGREYIVENKCPFCAKKLEDKFKIYMDTLDNLFDKKNVEALSKMESIFDSISNLVSEDTSKFIDDVLKEENPILDDNKEKIAKLIAEITLASEYY